MKNEFSSSYRFFLSNFLGKQAIKIRKALSSPQMVEAYMHNNLFSYAEAVDDLKHSLLTLEASSNAIGNSQPISFDSRLAYSIIENGGEYTSNVDFRLPFPGVFLHFSSPIIGLDEEPSIVALSLTQDEVTQDMIDDIEDWADSTGNSDYILPPTSEMIGDLSTVMFIVFKNNMVYKVAWVNKQSQGFLESHNDEYGKIIDFCKNLAIACIGYINCENVYLHKEDGAPAAVNRKRAAKGKATIEPYYTCRIRGVNYDNPAGTGKGTSPGHIFDVRGHFRRLDSGKVTWVRPHLRGLKSGGEYVPKVYTVDVSRETF